MKLRLLLLEECNRRCKGCCNKDWDLSALPTVTDFRNYELVMLTGGEPMLYPGLIASAVSNIRAQTTAPVVLYTAKVDDAEAALNVLNSIDGMTVTLHARKDIAAFLAFDAAMVDAGIENKKLRLNVFAGVSKYFKPTADVLSRWKLKGNIVWIKDCPLPTEEVLARYTA